jgi:hypothetical protein
MKVIKVGYLNDERKDITLRVLDLRFDHTGGDNSWSYVILKSCEYREFELHVPDEAILFVKKWPSMVMLSYHEQSVRPQAPQPDEPPQCGAV